MDPQTTGNTSSGTRTKYVQDVPAGNMQDNSDAILPVVVVPHYFSHLDALRYQVSSLAEQEKFSASNIIIKEKPLDFLQSVYDAAIAGAVAGVVVETALYPIDTIKTRLQAAHGCGKIILKGLYSGLSGNLAGVLPASAIFLGVYEPIKQNLLTTFPEKFSALAHLVVKQRMQTGHFTTAPNAVRMIVSKEGFKGLYAGYGSFLLRDLPFDAIQFCIYEQIRIGYKLAARRELNDPENALIGAFAGAITGAITTPLDVIKTRLMIQGMAPRVIWIGIGGSIFFGVLEKAKRVLSQGNPSIPNSDLICTERFDSK
ncbi:hypothetical protein KSS87_000372 [Heliosperma pusillum]|nr:hypothetical protein KSS87_000372 [Heliosperma pusillum]